MNKEQDVILVTGATGQQGGATARGRLGQPEDVAALVAFLCSAEARHVQGVAVAVDGGATLGVY